MNADTSGPVIRADEQGRQTVAGILRAAIGSIVEYPMMQEILSRSLSESPPGRLVAVAIGKAALSMSRAAQLLAGSVDRAMIVVPHGYRSAWSERVPWDADLLEAGHPQPDEHSSAAAVAVERLVSNMGSGDRVLALISGGGSALVAAPIRGVDRRAFRDVFEALYTGGLPITEVNAVRRGISRLGGGGLLSASRPASVLTLVLSDVPGDDPCTVASGPTCQLSGHEQEQTIALVASALGNPAADAVRAKFDAQSGTRDNAVHLVGSNADALEAVRMHCRRQKISVATTMQVRGEARAAGKQMAYAAVERLASGEAFVFGGETTVTVTGSGRGGRCQEFVLGVAAAIESQGRNAVVGCVGTDGRDGPTDAAGAVALVSHDATDWTTTAGPALERNDAYPLLESEGALLFTGPTHTNVMDVGLIVMVD